VTGEDRSNNLFKKGVPLRQPMRIHPFLALALTVVPVGLAGCLAPAEEPLDADVLPLPLDPPPAFGVPGSLGFRTVLGPPNLRAPEPTLGIPWNTDNVFYHAGFRTFRITFDAAGEATWTDVTAPYQVPINLDPMLHVDPDTNRIWAGGLHGICSVMMYSDDDGESWTPTRNMCSGKDFDHQSIGSGPSPAPLAGTLYPHTVYYCAQGGTISCATSQDGGATWGPFVTETTPCRGFHGHIRVSRVTGMMALPVPDCGGNLGMLATYDGITYVAKIVPDSHRWTNGFDSALQFGREEGWLWYAMASEHGIYASLSKDDGDTWETIGEGMGVPGTHYLDIGQFHDPPVVSGVFTNIEVGDDDRAAVSFLGLEGRPGADLEFLRSKDIYQCVERQDELVWHYYVAFTYDAGQTWRVERISEDPVQVGGIWDVVSGGSGRCRNLLDFNGMALDSLGRVHISWADGCVDECAQTAQPDTNGYRTREARLFRQETGMGLFAKADANNAAAAGGATAGKTPGLRLPGFALG